MTDAYLEGYKAGGNIQTSRGIKFRKLITKLFPEAKRASRQKWVTYWIMASKLYYDPDKPSVFATLKKLQEAARQSKLGRKPGELKTWL